MQKSGLKVMAVVLAALMALVWFAGLDDLPRNVRAQIATEKPALADAQKRVAASQQEVAKDLSSEPALFHALPSATLYNDRLARANNVLSSATRDMDQLAALQKANRRTDAERATQLLAHERQNRTAAVADAESVRTDAAHWIELKKHLPEAVRGMEADYKAVQAVNLEPLTAAVQKAQTDWPEKRTDLQVRLDNVRGIATRADQSWQASAAARQAAANNDPKVDYATLFAAGDTLKTAAADLPKKSAELKSLTGQLYESWDKMLVDQQHRDGKYEEKLRTVRTRDGSTTSDEAWVDVGKPQYEAMERNLGMSIEHKGLGKYDSESERVAQPAGFAYMAPPGQRNQYGYWDHSGGHDFWVFYGQYALMRDLLFNRDYRPLDRYEYEDYYRYRQRNQTYYGRDESNGSAPKYGTQGTTTHDRYAGSTFAKGGGFKDSKYASKPGGYRDSQYATPSMRDPNADHSGRTFGSGSSRPSQPRAAPPSRSAPSRPSMPRSSPGRTFGSRRR
jgi:hypothetical protein